MLHDLPDPAPPDARVSGTEQGLTLEVALLKADVSGLKNDIADLAHSFRSFSSDFNRAKQWNWNIIGPMAIIGGICASALAMMIQIQIAPVRQELTGVESQVSTLNLTAERLVTWQREVESKLNTNSQVDSTSSENRKELDVRVTHLEDKSADNAAKIAVLFSKLCEIETQFASDESNTALRDLYIQRWIGVFYEKMFNAPLPALGATPPGLAAGKPCSRE